jgi:DNA adenine methylase
MKISITEKSNYVKSPLNYIGGKYKLLSQILPKFPKDIDTFLDLFAGGCNVGVNVNSSKLILNDNIIYLIEMFRTFYSMEYKTIISHIESRISGYELSKSNDDGYNSFRNFYNKNKNPLDLFVLIAYSFNHQIRYNKNHEFNNPFGRNRSSFNPKMRTNLENFIAKLKSRETLFSTKNFDEIDYTFLGQRDFVYCDPPYLITTGTYNDGKRGFTGWGVEQEISLCNILDNLDERGIRFALSNVIEHNGVVNTILSDWLGNNNYGVHYLNKHYSNSNYQLKDKTNSKSLEVLITNY